MLMNDNFSKCREWGPRGTSQHKWRWLTTLLLILTLGIGQMWGATYNVTLNGGTVSSNGITLTGDYVAQAQVGNNSQKAPSFNTNNSSAYIFSESTNITGISFRVCRNTNGASANSAVNVMTSTGGVFSAPESDDFTATNSEITITSLSGITAVGNNQTSDNAIVITFTNPVKAVELRKQAACNIHNIVVTYNTATAPSEIFNATISGSTPTASVTPVGASLTLSVISSSPKTIGSDTYYKWDGDNTISLGSGKFQVGDQILADVCGGGNSKTVGFKVNSGTDEHTIILSATAHGEVCYTVRADDGVAGESSVTLIRKDGNTCVHSFRVLRPAPTCAATEPGDITKSYSGGKVTMTAGGTIADGDTWYWQTAANGTEKGTYGSGKTKEIIEAGTWYVRSYNTDGDCWSAAKSVEVTSADFVVKYAITKGTHANGDFTISPAEQEEGEEVTLSATPAEGYIFSAWEVVKTSDGTASGVTVTNNKFAMPAFAVTVNATFVLDPCHTYFWFSKAGDVPTGVTNNEGSFFTTSASGSNGVTSSITIDGVEYAITNRTSNIGADDATIVSFTIPANKAGTFHTNMASSGNKGESSSRTLYLKKGGVTVVTSTNAIYGDGAQHNATIENIPTGTYTLHANNNVKVGMFAVKVCDATYRTITLDLDGGTGTTSVAAIDGVPAYKPADPTKEHADFVKWVVKSTSADYDWTANVTGDLELKAIWAAWPTLTLAAGEGATGDPVETQYKAGTEITVPEKPAAFSKGTDVFTGWAYSQAVEVNEGKFEMPSTSLTLTAQWQAPSNFDVKFYQGYGEPNAQIGETQNISTGNYATAPDPDPTREGYEFLGWSTDGTEANIVDVASHAVLANTDFTAVWKQVWTVTFDGAGAVNVEDGEAVASPNSPVMAGKVFQGWYNGESKYDFSAAVTSNLALTSKWADADANHYVYAYNDDFHFDGVVYKTPEGKVDAGNGNQTLNLTTPYTLFSGTEGITSIVMTDGIYDSKAGAIQAVTSHLKVNNNATSKLTITIKAGYTATLKIKAAGYSASRTMNVPDATPASLATPTDAKIVTSNAMTLGTLEWQTFALASGSHDLTVTGGTLYISELDVEAEALPTFTVTYKAGEGTGDDVEDTDATEVADVPGTFTAPEGKIFNGWKDGENNDVEVGTIVTGDMTLTAQWINHYAVTFNMNDHGDAIDSQDIKHGEKATRPDDPVAIGFDFGGWFTDNGTFEAPFDFNTSIIAATPLYAKWTADPCPDKKSIVKAVMATNTTATVTGYNSNEYAGGYIVNNLADDASNTNMHDFGEGEVKGFKLKGSNSAIFATLSKGGFEVGDQVVFAVTKNSDANKLAIYAAKDKDHVLKLVELDVDAAGIYTYRLTQDNIDAIEAAGSDYLSIGTFRGDYNPYIYSVELKGCRSWAIFHTLTFKNIDGTATIAAESLEEGAYASTVAPAAPKIAMKRFLGWSESIGGSTDDLTTYTITEDKTLYAVYEDIVCPTSGTVYKFEIKDELPSENLPTITDKDMSSYITATGDGYLTYTATANNKATINSDGTIQMKDPSAAYLKVELECALAAGDQIRAHVTNNPMRVQVGTTYDSDKDLILAKNAYEFVTITSAMEGKQVLYITRSSNGNAYLADFEIYRPAKYDVSFNMMGHGTQIADIEDVIEGSKITAPTAPTDAEYSFAGWYKENTLENEWKFDVDVVETNTTLYAKWLDKSDATLKSLKYGETEIALEAGVYTYNVSLPAFTSAVPALTAETSNPNATKVIANAAAFDSEGNATSTVTVTPEVGADQVYYVNFAKGVEILLQDVTGSITWNFANAVTGTVNITGTPQVLANYGGVTNDNTFESDKLEASGEKFTAGSNANLRANYIRFHTTVPGKLSISYSNTGGSNPARYIYVNGVKYDEDGSASTTKKGLDTKVFVPAGDVELVMKDGEGASKNVQIYQMIFNATPDYTRPVTEGRYGTICLPNGGVMTGAMLFDLAYFDPDQKKIFFDEVINGTMEAGTPYIFLPNEGVDALKVFYTDAAGAVAGNANGLFGSYTQEIVTPNDGNYILLNNQYCFVNSTAYVGANRAYIKLYGDGHALTASSTSAPQPAPGRRRVSLDVQGEHVATGMEGLNVGDQPIKLMINGQMYILRGDKMYDATGRLVK